MPTQPDRHDRPGNIVTPVAKAGALLASTPSGTGSPTALSVKAKTVIPQTTTRDRSAAPARS